MSCDEKVYAVLFYNYGDQGSDFKGVFATREAAEAYIRMTEPNEHEAQYYEIVETQVQK